MTCSVRVLLLLLVSQLSVAISPAEAATAGTQVSQAAEEAMGSASDVCVLWCSLPVLSLVALPFRRSVCPRRPTASRIATTPK